MRRRFLARILLTGLLLGALAVPMDSPPALVGGIAAGAMAVCMLLLGDWLLDRWLHARAQQDVGLGRYLARQLPALVLCFSALAATLTVYLLWKLPFSSPVEAALNRALLGAGVVAGASLLYLLVSRFPRVGVPHKDLLERLPEKPEAEFVAEALDFNRIMAPRLLPALLWFWLEAALVLALVLALAAAGCWFGVALSDVPFAGYDFDRWPWLTKFSAVAGAGLVAWLVPTVILATLRLVDLARGSGRIPRGRIGRELGLAVERAGILGTTGWGVLNLAVAALLAFTVVALAGTMMRAGLDPAAAWGIAGGAVAVAAFLIMLLPQIYTLPILVGRENSWISASEAGTTLLQIERGRGAATGLRVLLWSLTIWRIPAAAHLLLAKIRRYEMVLARIFNEKSEKEIEAALGEGRAKRTAGVERAWRALEAGRYLDALNGFQMYQRGHREDVDSLKGEALALLYMGNPLARECLERWERLAEDDPEPAKLLKELTLGEWREGGARYNEAMARCTQTIGRGV